VATGSELAGRGIDAIDHALGGALRGLAEEAGFTARLGHVAILGTLGRLKSRRVALLGLGDADRLDRTRLGNALHLGLANISGRRASVAVAWNEALPAGVEPAELAEAAVEAAVLVGFTQATHRGGGERRRRGAAAGATREATTLTPAR
jgi:hypothetical protein